MDIQKLTENMIAYNAGDPKRIQHSIKVAALAHLIGTQEGLRGEVLETLDAAAVLHDVGIREAEKRFGKSNGKLQEELGPAIAEKMLAEFSCSAEMQQRVSFLIAHHHTYNQIDGPDYQILVEADFLVNLYEDEENRETVRSTCERIFKTETGTRLCREMFGL